MAGGAAQVHQAAFGEDEDVAAAESILDGGDRFAVSVSDG
jgi:hypothetical protein